MLDLPFYMERMYVTSVTMVVCAAAVFTIMFYLSTSRSTLRSTLLVLAMLAVIVSGFSIVAAHDKWYDRKRCEYRIATAADEVERRIRQVWCD